MWSLLMPVFVLAFTPMALRAELEQLPEELLSSLNGLHSYQNPTVLLQTEETVYLYEAPPAGWNPSYTKCMKSKLLAVQDEGTVFLRTIEYYQLQGPPNPIVYHTLNVSMKVVAEPGGKTVIQAVEFSNGGALPKEKPKKEMKPKKTESKTKLEPRSITNGGILFKRGVNKIPVIFASNSCVVLDGSSQNGKQGCTLWATESATSNPPRCCRYAIRSHCSVRVYETYLREKEFCEYLPQLLERPRRVLQRLLP
uniref:Putative secreted protein n=1 Tax=Amblyomma americanum TaxID=6943 RepID=A0A0C9S5G3_AMBAM